MAKLRKIPDGDPKYDVALRLAVRNMIAELDLEMMMPSTPQRGMNIAAIMNKVEMSLDLAERFGLQLTKKKTK